MPQAPLPLHYETASLRFGDQAVSAIYNDFLTEDQPAASPRMHVHPARHVELILFWRGDAEVLTEQAAHRAAAGSVAVIPPLLPHRLRSASPAWCRTLLLAPDDARPGADADGRLAAAFFRGLSDVLLLPDMAQSFSCIDALSREVRGRRPFYSQAVRCLLERFLIDVFRAAAAPAAAGPAGAPPSDKHRMLQIEDYLGRAMRREGGCAELAASLHLSTRQLERLIQKLYGKNYRALLYEMRMQYARQLLTTEDMPLREISELLGYASVSAFHCAFRRFFGVTPASLRRGGP